MKPGTISSSLFALVCIGVTILSADILGPGLWGGIFLGAGILVAASPYYRPVRGLGRAVALIAGILALLATALGLLAATIGGAFRLPADQALLLVALALVGVLGITVFKTLAGGGETA